MSFTFNATEGGASTNSLCSVEFADDYFGGSLYAAEWPATSTGADLLKKQQALCSATRYLDSFTWAGVRTNIDTQRLQFPRIGLVNRDGLFLSSTVTPREMKEANCELALHFLQVDPVSVVDDSLKQFKRLKIANVLEMEMRDGLPNEEELPARVFEMVGRFLNAGGGVTRLMRA